MSQYFSPKEVATAIGVSESSLKRWVDKGLIRAEKTAGGHRRLELDAVLEYVRGNGHGMCRPEALGLPAAMGMSEVSEDSACGEFLRALVNADEETARRIALELYIARMPVARIFDQIFHPAFERIGDLWKCGELEVYEERRACETCLRVMHELRRAIGAGPANGPVAVGGTVDGDPYTLASSMAELVLRDAGWRANSLGNMLPFETLGTALQRARPDLMWLSVTEVRDQDRFVAHFNMLFDMARSVGAALVVGGRALSADLRQRLRYTTFCDTMQHLEAFARTIRPRGLMH